MLEILIPSVITVVGGITIFCVRTEHRLTKIETKVDLLLSHNGINPKKKEDENE